jgi:hypothetical protein
MYAVYDFIFDKIPARDTVYIWFRPTLHMYQSTENVLPWLASS